MKLLVSIQRYACCLSIGLGLCCSLILHADVDVDGPTNTTTVSGNESSPVTSYQQDGTVNYVAGTQHITSSTTNSTFMFNYGGNTITLQPGALLQSTGQYGLWISNAGDDNINTLHNAGTISATSSIGHAIYEHTDSTGSDIYNYTVVDDVITPGIITGQLTGIVKNGTGSIYNYGTIRGVQDNGIAFSAANSSLYNYANDDFIGTITGQRTGVVILQTPTEMINQGIITGTTQHGMYFQAEGQVTNTGTITGNSSGILFNDHDGTVINDGNINGTIGVNFYDATGSLTNNANGVITAEDYGVFIDDNGGYVLNYGTIRATGSGSHAIDADGTSQIQNYGTFESLSTAIYAYGQTSIVNGEDATITSQNNYGIWMSNGGSVVNYGTITGGNSTAAIKGVNTLTNYGTIDAHFNSNRAVDGTSGDDTFTIYDSSSITGGIMGMGGSDTLILTGDGTGTMSTSWSANGMTNITKQGTGSWTVVSGNSLSAGSLLDVQAGQLYVNGTASFVNALVQDGSLLGGTGNFNGSGALTVNAGGTLAPGNSIGGMTLNSDLILLADSILQIEVNAAASDYINVNGDVTLAGDLQVNDLSNGTITAGTQYNFISADAFSGAFANILDDSALLDFTIDENGQYLRLTAVQTSNFADHARPHQSPLAKRLDSAMSEGKLADLTGALQPLNEEQLREQMDRLRPNGAPIRTVFTNAQHFSTDTLQLARSVQQGNTRFAAAPGQSMLKQLNDDPYSLAQDGEQVAEQAVTFDGKLHFFASPFGQFGDIDSSDARTGYSYDAYGAIIGLDYNCIPNMSLGLSLGYINTDIGLDNSAGDSKVDTLRFGPYLTYNNGNWNVDASITGGFHWIDANRNTIMGTAESDNNSYDFTIYGAASYDMQLNQVTLSPTFSLTYVHQMTDDYAESGAGSANLTVEDMQTDSLQSLLGVHASMPVMLGNMALTPEAWIGWKYEWLDRDVDINSAFSANVTSPFTSTSQGTSRSQLVAGAAVFSQINEMTSLKLNYELNTASDVTIHSVWAMIELNF